MGKRLGSHVLFNFPGRRRLETTELHHILPKNNMYIIDISAEKWCFREDSFRFGKAYVQGLS